MATHTEIQYQRDIAADEALRAIKNLRKSLDIAEEEINKGRNGCAMRPMWCVPNHQYLTEVVQYGERFAAYWNAAGMEKER